MRILNQIKNEFKSDFAKNILTVFSGLSISQIIPIIISPILTRLYAPHEFGLLALFLSTGMIFSNIATFQYDSAIMLPDSEDDAIHLLALSILATIFVSFLSLVIVVLFNYPLQVLMNNEQIGVWLYLVPLFVFISGLIRSFSIWGSRNKYFKLLAVRNITQTGVTGTAKLVAGVLKFTESGLIIGTLIGQFFASVYLIVRTLILKPIQLKSIKKESIIKNAITYKEFPLYTNWQGFFDILNDTGSRYIISNVFGASILGWYTFTLGLLQKPLMLIGQAISQVYYQKSSEIFINKKDLWGSIKKLSFRLGMIGFILFLPILLFGDKIFVFVYGSEWKTAGMYAQILSPFLFIKFINAPLMNIFYVLKKQRVFFYFNLTKNGIIIITLFLLSFWIKNFALILVIIVILQIVFAVVNFGLIRYFSKNANTAN